MIFADTRKILVCVILSFLALSLSAQVLNEQDLLAQPSSLLNLSVQGKGNEAYIQQVGSNNETELLQNGGDNGLGNLARVLQTGEWNIALITQTEQGNKLALIQRGQANNYELLNLGYENNLVSIQDGSGNLIIQKLIDSHQITGELIQVGNNNEIITILEGIQGGNLTIRQTGNDLKVTVKQSSF